MGNLGGLVIYSDHYAQNIVYIDGLNLYYGLLRRSPYKWLDLVSLFASHVLAGAANVVEVRYYTAPILGKMSNDPASATRQRTYLQALRKLHTTRLQIIEGQMIAGKSYQRLVTPIAPIGLHHGGVDGLPDLRLDRQ